MIAIPPYTSWALHVKLFTDDMVKLWELVNKDKAIAFLPPGFTLQVELEGVDGKSGKVGSGRVGPIDVSDCKWLRSSCYFSSFAYKIYFSRLHICASRKTQGASCATRAQSYLHHLQRGYVRLSNGVLRSTQRKALALLI
jgi:hypothetical protein